MEEDKVDSLLQQLEAAIREQQYEHWCLDTVDHIAGQWRHQDWTLSDMAYAADDFKKVLGVDYDVFITRLFAYLVATGRVEVEVDNRPLMLRRAPDDCDVEDTFVRIGQLFLATPHDPTG